MPPGTDMARWLRAFPSFGFLLSVAPDLALQICARAGLNAASDRVAARSGHACSSAMRQLARIEATAKHHSPDGPPVVCPSLTSKISPCPTMRRRMFRSSSSGRAGRPVGQLVSDPRRHRHGVQERFRAFHSSRENRWDSLCLVTPNWQCRLPGFPHAGDDPDGVMLCDPVVDYLDGFSAGFAPPLREGVAVTRVNRMPRGYRVATSAGVWLSSTPRAARASIAGAMPPDWLYDLGHHTITIDRHPDPNKAPTQTKHYMSERNGGMEIDLRRFALDGVQMCGLLPGADGTKLRLSPDLEIKP